MSRPTIICHRGWWDDPAEQNTLAAFSRAFDAGLGVELDVRDCYASLCISHDPVGVSQVPKTYPTFQSVLELLGDRDLPLAVNVKSCGLAPLFAALKLPPRAFFFDMAVPDIKGYKENLLPVYLRHSQFEPITGYDSVGSGLWVDIGVSDWFPSLVPLKPVCFASPELHGQSYQYRDTLWERIRRLRVPVSLCTDHPAAALEFFK